MQEAINLERIRQFNALLRKYKAGKANLERRIVENEQFWKLRHLEQDGGDDGSLKPTSAWLVNCILSKHADAMDAFPEPNCLPREPGDRQEAEMLSSILPVILEQNDFEQVWSDVWWYKLKSGTGVYKVVWDSSKHKGLGDISIKKADLLNLFWEPGITDIQDSPFFFHTELVDDEILKSRFPQCAASIGGSPVSLSRYIYDDTVDTSGKSLVVDVYYKAGAAGGPVLHYCKYTGSTVLFATENEAAPPLPDEAPISLRGFYDHGKYPFVFDVLFPEEGTPCGFGYIDLCKQPQKCIDMLNGAILKNALVSATPRWFVRSDGAVNEQEYADWTKTFVHTNGNLGADSIREITSSPLDDIYVSVLQLKIQEMKETSGNRDVNNGGTASGVTAASAIAAMQEQSGKLSRDMLQSGYRSFRAISGLCIELIRQFYDVPRCFRITGALGRDVFVSYDNARLRPRFQGEAFGQDMGYRLPVFDIEVTAQKQSSYTKLAYNELALQLYQLGFFDSANADKALACMDMMDFKGREAIMQKIQAAAGISKRLAQYQSLSLMLAQKYEPALARGLREDISAAAAGSGAARPSAVSRTDSFGKKAQEPAQVKKARADAANRSRPRNS